MLAEIMCPDCQAVVVAIFVLITQDGRPIIFYRPCQRCWQRGDQRTIRNVDPDPLPRETTDETARVGLPLIVFKKRDE